MYLISLRISYFEHDSLYHWILWIWSNEYAFFFFLLLIYLFLLFEVVADVILWRQKNLTVGILLVALAAWVVFEKSGYTLLSLVSSVFLLLIAILFLWAKSAAILNR